MHTDINIRSDRYFIARTEAICGYCHAPTTTFALGVPPGHEALVLDESAEDDAHADDTWSVVTHGALVFFIEHLSSAARTRMSRLTRCYRFGDSAHATGPYWANHCEACDSVLDDQDLFCEPGGAFLPGSEAAADAIDLIVFEERFEVAAAGYAPAVQFLASMSRG